MRTLAHSARRAKSSNSGAFLSPVFRPLEDAKIRARLGTATMIVGPPGAFKTGFAMYYFLRLNLPTIYMSADAEDFETVERAGAAVTGVSMDEVRRDYDKYALELEQFDNIRWVYEDAPSYTDLEMEVCAFAEVFGEFPKVIVIDNLMNLTGEQENEWASMRDSMRVIHRLTRITRAAVFILHHAADDRTDPSLPAPRKSLQGKVSQLPKAIWSVALHGDELRVAAVKSRWGPADPTGQTYATLYADPNSNRLFQSRYDMQNGRPA